ncbi:MAG: adenine deaminase, partial [Deltaproteobacteria bacterium]|nr:adenine deaminase [Deltaproteobacteria bacterium]
MTPEQSRRRVLAVALGRQPADVVLKGGQVVDVYTRRVLDQAVVGLAGERIAFLGPETKGLIGPKTLVEDLEGAYLLPGFIDAHTHLDSIFQSRAFVSKALPFGNTTSVTETAMIAAALGPEGVDLFRQDAAGLPMRIFFLTPSLSPPLPALETSTGFDDRAFERLLARPEVLGMGECYWPPVLDGDQRILFRFPRAEALGKTIEGHAAGAKGRKLMAYRAAGVLSCHEAINAQDARDRISLGLTTMIREGYVRREMDQVLPGLSPRDLDSGLVVLVTDLADPEELLNAGGMNLLLKKAVSLGVDPLRAVQMVTLNPARHFNLRLLGSITPGKLADMTAVADLKDFRCLKVWTGGQQVAQEGKLTAELRRFSYPDWTLNSFDLEPPRPEDLAMKAQGRQVRARLVVVDGETITRAE